MSSIRHRNPSAARPSASAAVGLLIAAALAAQCAAADEAVADAIRAQGAEALTRMTGELREAARWRGAGQQRLDELLQLADDDDEPARFADHGERG